MSRLPLANNIKSNFTKSQDLRSELSTNLPMQLDLHNFIGMCSIDVKIKRTVITKIITDAKNCYFR